MKFRNILSLFLCLTMVFTLGQSIAVSSSAKEYNASSISTCIDNTSTNSTFSLSTQKTASFWSVIWSISKSVVSTVAACSLVIISLAFNWALNTVTSPSTALGV